MRIVDVKTQLLQLPFTEVLSTTYGARTHSTIVLVSVESDEGVVGFGEIAGLFQETAETFLHTELKPLVLGQDPRRIEYIVHRVEHLIDWNSHAAFAIAAIDTALHDLKGRVAGLPVYELLGGLYRSEVQFDGLIHLHDPATDAAKAKMYVDRGFRTLKVKTGPDAALDERRLDAIRDAVGDDVALRLDYNMALSARTAVRTIERLEGFGIEYVEQPTPGWDIDALALVARSVSVPIAADESCMSPRDAMRLAEKEACEVFCVYISESGGITRAREITAIANTAGIACVLGTWGEGGVGFAAGLHLAASSRNFAMVQGTGYQIMEHDYVEQPLTIHESGGLVTVPSGAGLGVTPDPAKIASSAVTETDAVFRAAPDGIPRLGQVLVPAHGPLGGSDGRTI
jgi:L-alanine-DL-glutamate epimerase-like enolase superfamily enzyme